MYAVIYAVLSVHNPKNVKLLQALYTKLTNKTNTL